MIIQSDLEKCRQTLETYVGKTVKLVSNAGRKRMVVREGVLEHCYPNVFTVRCEASPKHEELVSYSYIDVLTSVVQVSQPKLARGQ